MRRQFSKWGWMMQPCDLDIPLDQLHPRLTALRGLGGLMPFDGLSVACIADVSTAILQDAEARHFPEIQVLGYWLRPSAVESYRRVDPSGVLSVPQGVVFHIPPANVDSLFAYTLALSILAGNANIVRLPSQQTAGMQCLRRILADVLARHPALAARTFFVQYPHDAALTQRISSFCDLRMVWGGDATVAALRAIPLPPFAHDVVFPDRRSLAAISLAAYADLSPAGRDDLAEHFANDVFWFGQNACASPRLLVWCGGAADADLLAGDFYARLTAVADAKGWGPTPGNAVQKRTRLYEAMLDAPVSTVSQHGPALTLLGLSAPAFPVTPVLDGSLFTLRLAQLSDLIPHLDRSCQTLAQFGFLESDLRVFALTLKGRGIDRIVPIGQALSFGPIWDGLDLMRVFTRFIAITV
jgi:hypothetical protein